jgi:hypothetical protein
MKTEDTARGGTRRGEQRARLSIGRLLLVSGPSTAGKTSFIRQLATGTLPRDVRGLLPLGAEHWAQSSAREYMRESRNESEDHGAAKRIPGLIFHYDTMRVHYLGFGDYNRDPALDIIRAADETLIVDLRASTETLEQHFLWRAARRKRNRWVRKLVHLLKRLRRPEFATEQLAHANASNLLDVYRQTGWLNDWYSRWDAFVHGLRATSRPIQVVFVEPIPRHKGEPTFRCLSRNEI